MDEKLNIKQKTNMAKKQLIKLTEGDLHKIIKESVKKILKESFYDGDTYSKFREDPDLSSYRIFRPSEEWEDYNEDNFMHGQNEDDDYFESLKEYITQEVLQTTQSIIEECENLNQQLKYGKENEDAYYDKKTSFFFDKRENCAFAVIVPKTNFEMNIYFRTNQKYGTYYSVYTPSTDDENNNELEVRGTLNYNTNKQESKRLYIGLIKAIIKNCLHNEDFDTSYNTNYVDFIINNTNVNNAIRNAYRELVKTQRNMVKLYSGNYSVNKKDNKKY